MAVGKHGNKKTLHKVLLANDSLVHAVCDHADEIALGRYQLVELANIYTFAHSYNILVVSYFEYSI